MGTRTLTLATACALAIGGAGCGAGDSKPTAGPRPVDETDKRGVALACLREEAELNVRPVGEKEIEIDGPGGPVIKFFQSSLEAEGRQFEGKAEGAQQIGAALLYVRDASEAKLEKVEACLTDQ